MRRVTDRPSSHKTHSISNGRTIVSPLDHPALIVSRIPAVHLSIEKDPLFSLGHRALR